MAYCAPCLSLQSSNTGYQLYDNRNWDMSRCPSKDQFVLQNAANSVWVKKILVLNWNLLITKYMVMLKWVIPISPFCLMFHIIGWSRTFWKNLALSNIRGSMKVTGVSGVLKFFNACGYQCISTPKSKLVKCWVYSSSSFWIWSFLWHSCKNVSEGASNPFRFLQPEMAQAARETVAFQSR